MPFTISSLRIISHSQWARAVSLWAGSLAVYVGGESQSPPLKFTIATELTRRSSSSPARNRSSLALPLREVLRANGRNLLTKSAFSKYFRPKSEGSQPSRYGSSRMMNCCRSSWIARGEDDSGRTCSPLRTRNEIQDLRFVVMWEGRRLNK